MDEHLFGSIDDLFRPLTLSEGAKERKAPFKFLDPYGPEDRQIYFGREYEVSELYTRLYKNRLLVVYGESGSGKTSLVQCGLRSEIPMEDAAFLTIRAATDPLEALGRELERYAGFGGEAPESVKEMIREAIFRKGKSLVLLFDQFEEFFLFQPQSVRETFMRELAAWIEEDLNIRVVLIIRQEYLAHMTELEAIIPELLQNRIWLRRMSRDQAREVILGPCRVCGVAVEEHLADTLLEDLTKSGGGVELPILQVVLDSLYRQAVAANPESPEMTITEYQSLGKVESILARFIEDTVNAHPQPDRVRQVLKALITTEGTKRISSMDQIRENATPFGEPIEPEELTPILKSLIDRRVLREDADNHLYELRHDALAATIHEWMTGLEQELMEVRQTIENRQKEYQHRGTLLDAATMQYITPYESKLRLSPELRFFVEMSRKAAAQKRRVMLALAGSVAAAFFIVVSALGLVSYKKYLDSERNMGFVFTERARQAFETQDFNASRLYSLYAMSRLNGKRDEVDWAEAEAYFALSPEYPVIFDVQGSLPVKHLSGLDFSPDGSTVAISTFQSSTVTLWDVGTGHMKATFSSGTSGVLRTRFSPDGNLIALSNREDRAVRIWNARSFKLVLSISNLEGAPFDESFSKDGRLLAFGLGNGYIHIWDVQGNKEISKWKAHTGRVLKVVFSPDGETLASCSDYGNVGLWNVPTGEEIIRFTGHTREVWGVCFSPDGKTLASCAGDGTVRIWDITSKKPIKILEGHGSVVWDVDFSLDGKLLASVAHDLRLWDTVTWRQTAVMPSGESGRVKFSPDGKIVVSGGSLRFWDVRTFAPYKSVAGHSDAVRSLALFPDGLFLVTGSEDHTLRRWEVKTGRQDSVWINTAGTITSVCILPEGSRFTVGSNDGTVQIREASSGKIIRTFSGHSRPVLHICVSPGGELLASTSADSTTRLWNLRTGDSRVLRGHTGGVNGACFTPDGSTLATCSDDGTIRLWDTRSGRLQCVIKGSMGKLLSIFSSPEGSTLVSISANHTVSVWNAVTHELSTSFREDRGAPQAAALSPYGDLLALGLENGMVTLWNMRSQERIALLPSGSNAINSIRFSPDGRILVAGFGEGSLRVWDVSPGLKVTTVQGNPGSFQFTNFSHDGSICSIGPLLKLNSFFDVWDVRKEYRRITIRPPEGYNYSTTFSLDNTRIATVSDSNTVKVWDMRTGGGIELPGKMKISEYFFDLSPDGSKIVFPGLDGVTRIWDVSSQRVLYTINGALATCFFSPDGSRAAVGWKDGWVRVLDIQNKRLTDITRIPSPLSNTSGFPWSQDISRDRENVAVMDSTRTIQVWDVWTGRKHADIFPDISNMRSLALSWDGSRLLVADSEGFGQVFDVKTGKLVSRFRASNFDLNSDAFLSPDGKTAAATGSDNVIRLWNADTGKPMASLKGHSNEIFAFALRFSPDCSRLVTGDANGLYHIWDMESVSLLSSTPIRQLIAQAEAQSRLTMKRFILEPDIPELNLLGTTPKPPVWPERHPFHWLDRAEKGDTVAMLKLGAIYERSGETDKAVSWYQKAAQAGSAEGKKKLELLQAKLKTKPVNPK
jgi:WD40 repeat protein